LSLTELLNRRLMVRDYLDQAVEPEKLDQVLNAALRGPSAGNSQGVSLLVIQNPQTRLGIARLAQEPEWVARGYPPWLSQAPVHLVLCAEPECYRQRYAEADKLHIKPWSVDYWLVDAGCALMLVLLAAVEQGLAAGFQGVHNLPGLADFLHIPSEVVVLGVITLGYPASRRPGHSSARPKRSGRVHWESW